jgi:WhiB family redox-sensing transcriptional regulator
MNRMPNPDLPDGEIAPEYDAEHEWMLSARCRELPPGTFFPSDGLGVEIAQRECAQCAVRVECLEYALENRIDHGVWGGASERERRRILRRRRGLSTTAPPAS